MIKKKTNTEKEKKNQLTRTEILKTEDEQESINKRKRREGCKKGLALWELVLGVILKNQTHFQFTSKNPVTMCCSSERKIIILYINNNDK